MDPNTNIKWDCNYALDDFTAWINGKCARIEQMDENKWLYKITEGDMFILDGHGKTFEEARDTIMKHLGIE